MGKNRNKKKPYTSVERRKKIERLLSDDEIYEEHELKERKKRIATVMRMQDYKLKKEQEQQEALGYCPHCYLALTTTKECMGHCGYKGN